MANAGLRVVKNTLALSAGRTSVLFLAFVFTVYAARLLGVEDFGKFSLARGYFDLLLNLCATGLCIVMTRDIAQRPDRAMPYFACSSTLVLALSALASGAILGLGYALGYSQDTQTALVIACLALGPAAVSVVLEAMFVAYEQAELVTLGTVLENVLRTALSIAALGLGFGLLSLFWILLGTRALMLAFYLIVFHVRIAPLRWSFDWAFFRRMLHDWRVFAAENWLANIYWSLDFVVLSMFYGEAVVGLYAAAYKILNLGNALASSYVNAVFPYISRLFSQSAEDFRRVKLVSFRYMLALCLPMVVTMYALADRIVVFLYTDAYAEAVPILQVLIWILLLRFVIPFLSHILFARGEQVRSLQVAVVSLVVHAGLAFALIPPYGAIGAASALLLAASIGFCGYFFFAFRDGGLGDAILAATRPAGVAVGLGLLVVVLREVALVPLIGLLGVTYVGLLFAFGLLAAKDLQMIMKLTSHGLELARGSLRRAESAGGGG